MIGDSQLRRSDSMASGTSGRPSGVSKGFDFAADDVLCSYDDFNGHDSDPKRPPETSTRGTSKEFREVKLGKSLMDANNPQEESGYQDVIATVEKTMKKYTDTVMRLLEGISGRLSQLELYCYSLERTIGELRSDLGRDRDESDEKLKSLDKHIQEVHRSVQILRDKQELVDTQKELAKLQVRQKEPATAQPSQHNEDKVAASASEPSNPETSSDAQNLQLSLALPRQPTVPVQQPAPPPSLPLQPTNQGPNQLVAYYPQQVLHQAPTQTSQVLPDPHTHPEIQYSNQRPQVVDPVRQPAQPQQPVNQALHYASYQQQWPQQVQQPQPVSQSPSTPDLTLSYSGFHPQTTVPPPQSFPSSMPMQVPFSNQLASNRNESGPFGYGVPNRTAPPPAHQHNQPRHPQPQPPTSQGNFAPHGSEGGYANTGPHRAQSNVHGYMMYETGGAPPSHPPHYGQVGGYIQQPSTGNVGGARPSSPHMMRNHPFNELLEKAVNMGFPREQVANALLRMEETGQPVDFNNLLDRLNSVPQRSW